MGAAQAEPTTNATFVAHFADNVPGDVRAAVEFAMSIWAPRLDSVVPINVDVEWGAGLLAGVAASTEPIGYEQVADGSFQPVALANAIAGRDLEPNNDDIRLQLGDGIRWYTAVDGRTPANATDMVSMVLHELTHGLGFADSIRPGAGGLVWGRDGAPVGLDRQLVSPVAGVLLATTSPAALLAAATKEGVVWQGSARDSHGNAPVMYAPKTFEPGSSLCHFDDAAYPPGDPDALMTSLLRRGEVIRHIGPAALGVLHDLGWTVHPEAVSASSVAASQPAVATARSAATTPAAVTTALLARTAVAPHRLRALTAVRVVGDVQWSGISAGVPLLALAFLIWTRRRAGGLPSYM